MGKINKFLSRAAVALAVAILMPSCSMDEPFKAGGEGTLNLTTRIKGEVVKTTRASLDDEDYRQSLVEKCVVYIESNKGLIRKFKGLQNINGPISLHVGDYVFEAWTGDSVSASYDKKFYRAYEKYTMKEGVNEFTLSCNIANVIVSVNPECLALDGLDPDNLKVTFSHSRGSLDFDKNNIPTDKGYFMMPNADKNLNYHIEGISKDGNPFEKDGVIEGVQRAHEYVMNLSSDPSENVMGGGLIRIMIEDIPVIEDEVEIFGKPIIEGMDGFDLESQLYSEAGAFPAGDKVIRIRGYQGFSALKAVGTENFTGDYSVLRKLDLLSKSDALDASLAKIGISYRNETHEEEGLMYREYYITFAQSFFNGLPASEQEYALEFTAEDAQKPYSKSNVGSLRIANTTAALGDPIATLSIKDSEEGYLSVKTTSVTLSGSVQSEDASGIGIKYREKGTSSWNYMPVSPAGASAMARRLATRAATNFSITLKDLKPGTTYEYAAYCEGFDEAQIEEFTTESPFAIINGSFEDWSTYSAKTLLGTKSITLPGSTGDKTTSFWGSGNEGSATANKTLTDKSTDMLHSGTYSVSLKSDEAIGVLAAGNIFIGMYDRTDGTNGVLQLGREYNGSHPSKLKVWVNYRPGEISIISNDNVKYLPDGFVKGASDHGQIYVALTTAPVEIRTNPSNRKLFDADNDETVVAYGQVTWTEAFGPDGQLQMVEIPFVYNERAKTRKPVYIIMVASASKFGDYFSGSPSSKMYLDDVELVYE